jgi:hypothetical protein
MKSENMGWRYLIFIIGGLTLLLWGIRFLVFPLHESPRFLLGQGKDAQAVKAVHAIAKYNRVEGVVVSEEMLEEAARQAGGAEQEGRVGVLGRDSRYSSSHVKALFATRKMALSTSLLIALWGKCLLLKYLTRSLS